MQIERNSFNSKLRRISQIGCNQVCSIIAYVNTREKIQMLSYHCQDKMHYYNTITQSYKTVTLPTDAVFEIV